MTHDNKLLKPNPRQSRADRKARYTLNVSHDCGNPCCRQHGQKLSDDDAHNYTDRGYDGDLQYSTHAGVTREELEPGAPKPIAGGPVTKCLQWEPTLAKDQT